MSYGIRIIIDEDGARIDAAGSSLQFAPKGEISISGHEVIAGDVGYRSVSVNVLPLPLVEGGPRAGLAASGGMLLDRTREAGPATQPGGIDLGEPTPAPADEPVASGC
jgi:hypothetical protein